METTYRIGMPRAHHRGSILDTLFCLKLPGDFLDSTLVVVLHGAILKVMEYGVSLGVVVYDEVPCFFSCWLCFSGPVCLCGLTDMTCQCE